MDAPLGFPHAADVLAAAIAGARWDATALAGPRSPPRLPGEPAPLCLPYPRLTLVLDGRIRHVLSRRGVRFVVEAGPGAVIHFATHAWDVHTWESPVRFLGLTFPRDHLRVLLVDHPGGGPRRHPSRTAHHTRTPLAGAARPLRAALDLLADRPEAAEAAGDLARGLARLALAHLRADLAGGDRQDHGRGAWLDVVAYIDEHLAEPLDRQRVAAVVGVHPNYLSALCRQHGGEAFQRTVEALRLERARGLLAREPGLPVAEVAARCGFADAGYFARVFRRRLGAAPAGWRRGQAG